MPAPADIGTDPIADDTSPWWIVRRCAAGEEPRHPTFEYAIIQAPTATQAAKRLARQLGGALSVHVDETRYDSRDAAIDAARGAQTPEEFAERPDVTVMEEQAP